MEKIDFKKEKTVYLYKNADAKLTSTRTKTDLEQCSAKVFDMAQNLAGFPEITVKGKRGDTITIFVSETLYPDGTVDQRQTGRPHIYTYICKGNGDETWHPRFSYECNILLLNPSL